MKQKMDSVSVVYYSPTDTTKKIATAIAEGTGVADVHAYNLTAAGSLPATVAASDLLVLAAPVYSGRVSPTALERFRDILPKGTPVIAAVVYGNRDYEDALLELCDFASVHEMPVVAAGAFIGEHSYSKENMPVAAGRPDEADLDIARRLGEEAVCRLSEGLPAEALSVKGNRPYREVKPKPPVAPVCSDSCTGCGRCISVCPIDAISKTADGQIVTDVDLCTLCCACVKKCTFGARLFDSPFTKVLYENFRARREPELF